MYFNPYKNAFVLIGTVQGRGYDCRTDKINKIEGSTDGFWNQVSQWVPWIRALMSQHGEIQCMPELRTLRFTPKGWF